MKKFFTLLMATVVALSMQAFSPTKSTKKATPNGRSSQQLEMKKEHRQQVMNALGVSELERKAMPKSALDAKKLPSVNPQLRPMAKTDEDVIELNYDDFSGFICYEEYGEWWVGLSCNDTTRSEYGYILQINWFAPADNPCGTFTVEDMLQDYTYLMTPYSYGPIYFVEGTMTFASEQVSPILQRYILDALLVGDDGYTYKVHAVKENFIPKAIVQAAILDATIATTDSNYAVIAQNDSLDIELVINSTSGIIGNFGKSSIDLEKTQINYNGNIVSPLKISVEMNVATHNVDSSLAYWAKVDMLGMDTLQYNLDLIAPLSEPTDTIDVVCYDLEVDDSWALMMGQVDFFASNTNYNVRGGWVADMAEPGVYTAAVFLDDPVTFSTISSLSAEIQLSQDENGNWLITGSMLGDNNKLYNLHLSWFIPEAKDTVLVEFNHSSSAFFYPELGNDLQLFNLDDQYSAAINIIGVEMGGEFTQDNMDMYYSYLEHKDVGSIRIAQVSNGKVYQVGDTTKLEADFLSFEGVLYQVRLWYVAPTPTKTVYLNIAEAELIIDFNYSGVYNLVGYTDDYSTIAVFTIYATSKEEMAGTFVNDGMFGRFGEGRFEYDMSRTYIGKEKEETEGNEVYDMYYAQKGTIDVVMDQNDGIKLTASVICSDSIQYEVIMKSHYEEPHLDFDSDSDPVERVYTSDATLNINDYTEDYALVSVQILDQEVGDITALYFVLNETEGEYLIPDGTYEINDSWNVGTVVASIGVDGGGIMPSCYAQYVDGYVAEPFYFFVGGQVIVSTNEQGGICFEVNAVNSYGIPIHITYENVLDALENLDVDHHNVRKHIINGHLQIIRGGKSYNALGVLVK